MFAVLAHDRAERLRDLARREGARGDLVEQRLEQVEVAPVDERDRHGSVAGEVLRGVQAAEPAADDHHVVERFGWVLGRHATTLASALPCMPASAVGASCNQTAMPPRSRSRPDGAEQPVQ